MLPPPSLLGGGGVLEEVEAALPKPERLLPNLIETHRGVEPGKIEELTHPKLQNMI